MKDTANLGYACERTVLHIPDVLGSNSCRDTFILTGGVFVGFLGYVTTDPFQSFPIHRSAIMVR
jgi:hypothetical protein